MRKGCQKMTQTVILGGNTGKTAGILLKSTRKIGMAKHENRKHQGNSCKRTLYLEILLPAETLLPETGTPLEILPSARKGTVVHCRITDSNPSFLRLLAEVRPISRELDPRDGFSTGGSGCRAVRENRNKRPWR